jgi:hypothetical protein
MAVTQEDLLEIGTILSAPEGATAVVSQLRARFPHLSWTRCDASDVTETPLATHGAFDLHLVDGHDHCVQITADPERATGVVLASRGAQS